MRKVAPELRHRSRHRVSTVLPMSCIFRSTKTFLPCVGELARQRQAAGIAELIADLVEGDAVAEPRRPSPPPRQRSGRSSATIRRSFGAIMAGLHRHVSLHAVGKYRSSCAHHRLQRIAVGVRASAGPYRHRPDRRMRLAASGLAITIGVTRRQHQPQGLQQRGHRQAAHSVTPRAIANGRP